MVGGCGVRFSSSEDGRGGSGGQLGDGAEEDRIRDSFLVFGLGCGFGPGHGSVWIGDDVVGPVSEVGSMGGAVFCLWA